LAKFSFFYPQNVGECLLLLNVHPFLSGKRKFSCRTFRTLMPTHRVSTREKLAATESGSARNVVILYYCRYVSRDLEKGKERVVCVG